MSKRRDARAGSSSGPAAKRGAVIGFPSKEDVLKYIAGAQQTVGKREIARAFSIKGDQRIALKSLLQEMADEGLLSGNRRALKQPGKLPPTGVFDIITRDSDGDLIAEPASWDPEDGAKPRVIVRDETKSAGKHRDSIPALGVGDRVLARTERLGEDDAYGYAIIPMKRLAKEKSRALGIYRTEPRGGGRIEPIEKREMRSWRVDEGANGDARNGDLVRFDAGRMGRNGVPEARVVEVLGNPDDQRQISLIAVHAHGIPDVFSPRVLAELDDLPRLGGGKDHTDMRDVPLITIDPFDARDHDDAVFAERDADPANPNGWAVLVAIADVAFYVRPGSALDREAKVRGNSVYFPDRVVPMLPEKISNDLCSLRELEDRPALAVRLVFDAQGHKRRHSFHRILMRSAVKLSYQEAQAAIDGKPGAKAAPLLENVLKPLWEAYRVLSKARDQRGPLDLNLPERKIVLDANGRVADVIVPERLEAHRLIEEFMIQANVAAAETLEEKKTRLVYRVHEQPSKEKLSNLREFLATLNMKIPHAGALKPEHFNGVLAQAKTLPVADLVNEVVLRSQAQAVYAPDNLGHFGLNLRRYAHFTSPIRRYADLIVHRALIRGLGFGPGGLTDSEADDLDGVAEAISQAERRAMTAERETVDRLIAFHLADRVGAEFAARVSGVTKSGLFVRLAQTGADGFIPISTLGEEYFEHNETAHALVGTRTGQAFRLGDTVNVKLLEAVPTAGALRFEMLTKGQRSVTPMPSGIRGQRRARGRLGRR
jgi:ribonuclease R